MSLYINDVQRYFRIPLRIGSRLYSALKYFMLTLSTLTLFVRDLCLSTVALYSSAWHVVHAPRPFLFLTTLWRDSCLHPVPRVPSHYIQTACVSLPLWPETFCLDKPRSRMSTANFPPLRGHFTDIHPQVCLSDHFATGAPLTHCFFTQDTNTATLADFCFVAKKRSLWKCHRALRRCYTA